MKVKKCLRMKCRNLDKIFFLILTEDKCKKTRFLLDRKFFLTIKILQSLMSESFNRIQFQNHFNFYSFS